MKRFFTSVVLVALAFTLIIPQSASALDGSEFQPGRIIDDTIFNNKDSMSVDQIQQFLNAKVGFCDSWGTASYAGTTRRAYSEARGIIFPLTCVNGYYENPTTKENNLEGRPIPAGAWSAAQIIQYASQQYNINPQTLIVLLQKEQGLVTDDWPWPIQYRGATGYGCPDTALCDSQYYGFYNQVVSAAWQFRHYANNPYSFNHIAGQNNSVRYSPNAACGASTVYIQNQSTASLYNYTPYQPNAASLANLYGSGDGCSSYGNRNFWRYFNDWFGSTLAPIYSWEVVNQYAYTDNTKATAVDLTRLKPGQRVYVGFTARNTGLSTWTNSGANPVRVGTNRPIDHQSAFCDSTWISCSRPAVMQEASVSPGGVGTFEFWYQAPYAENNYFASFRLLAEGLSWMPDIGQYFYTQVRNIYSWQTISQTVYTDNTKATNATLTNLKPLQRVYVQFKIRNTGNVAWSSTGLYPLRLGTNRPIEHDSAFCDSTWTSCKRAATMQESFVSPGEVGTFEFWYKAPYQGGAFNANFRPVLENLSWLSDSDTVFYTTVQNPTYTWENVSQTAYIDSTKATTTTLTNLKPGQRVYVSFKIKNTGNFAWQNTGNYPMRLGTNRPVEHSSAFCDETWLNCRRPATQQEASVAPGQTATFEFWYKAPYLGGVFNANFRPVLENLSWLNDSDTALYTTVQNPTYTWENVSQTAYTDSTKATTANLQHLQRNQRVFISIRVKNTSTTVWRNSGNNPTRIGTSDPLERISAFSDSTWIYGNRPAGLVESEVQPNQTGTFEFWYKAPATSGSYHEHFTPLTEGIHWFNNLGLQLDTVVE